MSCSRAERPLFSFLLVPLPPLKALVSFNNGLIADFKSVATSVPRPAASSQSAPALTWDADSRLLQPARTTSSAAAALAVPSLEMGSSANAVF